ncbi:unnamed protein product [Nesidiocoris tenuis]|uniref:Uncharacterized protein n=1 Tax=Nesidiocoris tenuis TaxID=355587 RepID=A0A6H5FW32_9HEMI|nr:unnamed protein product [Nesidiocoris tenuis]
MLLRLDVEIDYLQYRQRINKDDDQQFFPTTGLVEVARNSNRRVSNKVRMNPKWNRKTVHNESDEWINWSVYWFNIDNDVNGVQDHPSLSPLKLESRFVSADRLTQLGKADHRTLSAEVLLGEYRMLNIFMILDSNLKWKVVILGYQDKFRGSLPEWDSVPGQWDILLTLSRNQRGFHSVAPSNKFNQHLARVNIDSDSTSF